jgi:OOP family OmpA-OmpF porin
VPQNLGSKINTSGFDGSFSMDSDSIGFYISGEGNSGSGDIFAINLVPPPPPPPVVVIKDTVPPPPPPVVVKEEPARVDTFSQALFEFNSVVIREDSKEGLNTVVSRLNKNKLYKVQVEGHTDNVGPEAYNQKLSEKRANSVRQYLLAQGIPAKNIKVQGFGELNPIATNDSDEGRSQNRRVEIKYFISR